MSEMLSADVFRRRPPWRGTVDIKDLLREDDDTGATAASIAKAIADRLKDSGYFRGTNFINRFRRTRTLSGVNRNLELLYDYCDRNRIWLGL